MLAMTDAAAEAISALTAQDGSEGTAGLRFAVREVADAGAQLGLTVAATPEDGDQVLATEGGAKVFLEPEAAQFLDDKVLDIQPDDEGQPSFAVMQQGESA